MVRYRRNRVPGGTFFFTVTLRDRRSDLLVRHIDLLGASWRKARERIAHEVVAVVVLPEHLHAVITMRDEEGDYSGLWREIKKGFTRGLAVKSTPWQMRFWEHTIRDAGDLASHIDYVHANPVKHGLVARVAEWPHSSFHRHVRLGLLPQDWGGEVDPPPCTGERDA
ncbi:REP-associated tyrosine transposase [Luteimonas kalidii]|uniref:Transposase n=1 Tax=Luteimonas kalidii TaxID=3042025 RepID=A0ABT6JWX4_9GAMM|nr:transposase [Luteimonas kalidii]MDH5835079.1 transposase [Luteimonas kalidii]